MENDCHDADRIHRDVRAGGAEAAGARRRAGRRSWVRLRRHQQSLLPVAGTPGASTESRKSGLEQGIRAMRSVLVDAWRLVVPPRGDRNGPLSPLLLGLTVLTGLVDAFSYLVLGHVFVANMTGNVVFSGFAITGAPGFSLAASLAALA